MKGKEGQHSSHFSLFSVMPIIQYYGNYGNWSVFGQYYGNWCILPSRSVSAFTVVSSKDSIMSYGVYARKAFQDLTKALL